MLPLLITPTGSTPLFGRNWMHAIKLDWPDLPGVSYISPVVSYVSASKSKDNSLEDVMQRHSELFAPGLGCYTGDSVQLGMIKNLGPAKPVLCPMLCSHA